MRRPNIALIVLDTLRFDAFWQHMPETRSLAEQGLLFLNARANSNITPTSHASLFTGLYPSEHGTNHQNPHFDPPTRPVAEALQDVGYQTVAISCNPHLISFFGWNRGFQEWHDVPGRLPPENPSGFPWEDFWEVLRQKHKNRSRFAQHVIAIKAILANGKNRRELLKEGVTLWKNSRIFRLLYRDKGAQWVLKKVGRARWRRPYFLFVNLMEVHGPYDPPKRYRQCPPVNDFDWRTCMFGKVSIDPEERRRLWLSYLGEARYLDSVVKRLVKLIASTADMIILTSDHGEHFGEHELWWHGWGCYEELVHVPLVILGKDIPARKITDSVSHLDVHRTVLNVAGVEASSRGHDLTTDYRGDRGHLIESSGVYKYDAEAIRRTWGEERLTEWDTPQTAFVKGRRKLIIDRDRARVYDLKRDPQEQRPLKGKLLDEMVHAMTAEQQSLKLYTPQGEPMEDELPLEVVKRLEDLGYL